MKKVRVSNDLAIPQIERNSHPKNGSEKKNNLTILQTHILRKHTVKVKEDNDQEMVQSEKKNPHSKNQGGTKLN